jgi:hypothetical protein
VSAALLVVASLACSPAAPPHEPPPTVTAPLPVSTAPPPDIETHRARMLEGSQSMLVRDFAAAERSFLAATEAHPGDYDALVALAVARRAQLVGWPGNGSAADPNAVTEVKRLLDQAMRIDFERYEAHLDDGLLAFHFSEALGLSDSLRRSIVLQRMRHVHEHAARVPGCAILQRRTSRYVRQVNNNNRAQAVGIRAADQPRTTEVAAEPAHLVAETNRRRDAWFDAVVPVVLPMQAQSHDHVIAWTAKRLAEIEPILADYDRAANAGHFPAVFEAARMGIRLHTLWRGPRLFRLTGRQGSRDPHSVQGNARAIATALAETSLSQVRRCVAATQGTEHARQSADVCEPWLADHDVHFVPLHEIWSGAHPDQPHYAAPPPHCPCKVSGPPICDACERCREVLDEARRCRSGDQTHLQGSVLFQLRVDAAGEVVKVGGGGGGGLEPIQRCLRATVAKARFAPPGGTGSVVSLPITLVDPPQP